MLRTTAFQKAWSQISETHSRDSFADAMNLFERSNRTTIELDDTEPVPPRNHMRSLLKTSPFRNKQRELYNYYMFLTQNMYDMETMNGD